MTDSLTVRRWSRYGADRLFVTADTGRRLGSVDLISGEVAVDSPVLEDGLRRAAQEYLRNDVAELTLPIDVRLPATLDHGQEALQDGEVVPADVPCGARLDRLTADGWHVYHDVPLSHQGETVQHLLIGPGGVYSIGVYVHPGADVRVDRRSILVNHRSVFYLRDARWQAMRLERVLGEATSTLVSVRGVVVLHTGALASPRVVRMPDDALVLGRTDIPGVFRRVPRRLTDAEVEVLAAAADRKSTWIT